MTIPTPESGGMPAAPAAGGGINWKELMDASGGAFEPLPNGDYDVQVVKSEATKTSNQKTMFKLTLNVVAGPHTNRKLWTNLVISPENPNALGIFFAQMKALGLDANFFASQPAPEQVAQALDGKYARVTAKQKLYNGTMRNEVSGIQPAVIQGTGPVMGAPAPAPAASAPAPTPTYAAPAPAPAAAAPVPAAPAPAPAAAPVAPAPQPEQATQEAPAPQPEVQAAPAAQPVQETPAPAPAAEAPAAPAPQPEAQQAAAAPAPAAGTPAPPPIPF